MNEEEIKYQRWFIIVQYRARHSKVRYSQGSLLLQSPHVLGQYLLEKKHFGHKVKKEKKHKIQRCDKLCVSVKQKQKME